MQQYQTMNDNGTKMICKELIVNSKMLYKHLFYQCEWKLGIPLKYHPSLENIQTATLNASNQFLGSITVGFASICAHQVDLKLKNSRAALDKLFSYLKHVASSSMTLDASQKCVNQIIDESFVQFQQLYQIINDIINIAFEHFGMLPWILDLQKSSQMLKSKSCHIVKQTWLTCLFERTNVLMQELSRPLHCKWNEGLLCSVSCLVGAVMEHLKKIPREYFAEFISFVGAVGLLILVYGPIDENPLFDRIIIRTAREFGIHQAINHVTIYIPVEENAAGHEIRLVPIIISEENLDSRNLSRLQRWTFAHKEQPGYKQYKPFLERLQHSKAITGMQLYFLIEEFKRTIFKNDYATITILVGQKFNRFNAFELAILENNGVELLD